jgi:hypothetical protein
MKVGSKHKLCNFNFEVKQLMEYKKMKLNIKPGKQFEYVSGNTQLLGLGLEIAIKYKTIS